MQKTSADVEKPLEEASAQMIKTLISTVAYDNYIYTLNILHYGKFFSKIDIFSLISIV